jgi:hypothetical protein
MFQVEQLVSSFLSGLTPFVQERALVLAPLQFDFLLIKAACEAVAFEIRLI